MRAKIDALADLYTGEKEVRTFGHLYHYDSGVSDENERYGDIIKERIAQLKESIDGLHKHT